jgi:transketolase
LRASRTACARRRRTHGDLERHLAESPARARVEQMTAGDPAAGFGDAMAAYKAKLVADKPKVATRKASEMAPADLTHSNLILTKSMSDVSREDFSGRYVRYGIREHGMAAAMNGLALHGGFVRYGGTVLVFSDYARGARRVSALMEQRVIYVLTHDSLGLGEDRWIGERGALVGMTDFGASAPAPDLQKHFGITPEAVAASAHALIA